MKFRNSRAFALPAVLISSIVMLIVMLSAITSAVAVRVSLDSQYYNMLARNAGDAGTAYAKACLAANGNVAKWSDAKPLMPNTDCSGNQLAGFTCTAVNQLTEPRCSVSIADGNTIASFSVPTPSVDSGGKAIGTKSVGNIKRVRSSNSDVWRNYNSTVKSTRYNQVTVNLATVKQLSSGDYTNCVIASDDQAYCWGYGVLGELGNGLNENSTIPVAISTGGVLGGRTIKSISPSNAHVCAIASDNQAYCWGAGDHGILGNGSTSASNIPVAVNTSGALSGKTIKSISTGELNTCVIASDDQAYCWGYNNNGQLGNNSSITSTTPVAVNTSGVLSGKTIKSISTGEYHTCVIASDDQAYCWGLNSSGQLGNNSSTGSLVPVAVNTSGVLSGKTIKSISSGDNHTCAIASNDQVYCWGYNSNGQLGNNTYSTSTIPVAIYTSGVLSSKTIKSISSNGGNTCVIASDNNSYCWGAGDYGQIGNGMTYTGNSIPVAVNTSGVLSGKTIKSISSSGGGNTCAIASDDQVYCWGRNSYGELANGSLVNSLLPKSIFNGIFSIDKILKYQIINYFY